MQSLHEDLVQSATDRLNGSADTRLKGRVCVVTGASRGLGRAVALELARHGASVVINYLERADAANEVADLIRRAECECLVVQADTTSATQVARMVDATLSRFGQIDVLVNNAGIWRGAPLARLESNDWNDVLSSHLSGMFNCTRAVLPSMLDREFGKIICMSSAIGLIGFPGDAAYSTAKMGMLGFVRSLAKEVATRGITVNAVAPGYIETDMTAGVSDRGRELMLSRTPMRRPGRPDEVADAVVFLASAATYITGQVIVVDGGMSL